ncbi:alpha/beta fold hydrolase [Butyricimonas hominis]|uniref:Alpha/beta hydrolase n=1 Tax=Butyricimonas hominis TaxID=2763032 RepID=A0ABR7D4T8_9BACT|nr:alpha/beta hydrolase [Butyricimonas hominis]MBC5622944.1 alpha/beta hydrolase [Butyricimonas hominis]
MNITRRYGSAPYSVVLVHGGPGAKGSLKPMAEELSLQNGVLEPFQTRYSIEELIQELHEQVCRETDGAVTFVGHSWGAWLIILFAVRYPERVKQLVLVGCPPFEEKYVPQIMDNRLKRLSPGERERFERCLPELSGNATDKDMEELGKLVAQCDNYHVSDFTNEYEPDGQMYARVWTEAATLRREGYFMKILPRLRSEVHVIHGSLDPHPLNGIIEPLREAKVNYDLHVLERCGHSPFLEIEAKEEFYKSIGRVL